MSDFSRAIEIRTQYAEAYKRRASIKNTLGDSEGENADIARAREFTSDERSTEDPGDEFQAE